MDYPYLGKKARSSEGDKKNMREYARIKMPSSFFLIWIEQPVVGSCNKSNPEFPSIVQFLLANYSYLPVSGELSHLLEDQVN